MNGRAIVVGAKITDKKLLAAAPKGSRLPGANRAMKGGLAWILVAHDPDEDDEVDDVLDPLARKVRVKLTVFDVEVPVGMRGAELTAWRYEAPGHERERNLTRFAAKTLEKWTDGEGTSEEDAAAAELAWYLASQGVDVGGESS